MMKIYLKIMIMGTRDAAFMCRALPIACKCPSGAEVAADAMPTIPRHQLVTHTLPPHSKNPQIQFLFFKPVHGGRHM